MSDEINIKRRKRGIKASRVKLEKALINAGFKTQAALAKHIAEVESTDSIPKDIVNRVFREVSVSLHTLERIANVLGVEAYTLYLTNDDIQPATVASKKDTNRDDSLDIVKTTASNSTYGSQWKYSYIILLLLTLCLSTFFIWQVKNTPLENTPITLQTLIPTLDTPSGKYSLALRASLPIEPMAQELQALLKNNFNVIPKIFQRGIENIQTGNIERESQVDFVVNMQLTEFGRFWLIESSLIKYANKIILTRELMTKAEFLSLNGQFTKQLANMLNILIAQGLTTLPNEMLPSLSYLTLVGEGLSLLDESNDLNKVKQAQNKFLLAKDIDETLPLAKAGICLSYLYESWSGDEKTLLSRAKMLKRGGGKMHWLLQRMAFYYVERVVWMKLITMLNSS